MSGFNYSPTKPGSEKGLLSEIILESLNDADGDALSKDPDGFVYAENLAVSRALAYLWGVNKRLSYQFDPKRMTDYISRWEYILSIIPPPDATNSERRAVIDARISSYGESGIQQVVTDALRTALGSVFDYIQNSGWAVAAGSAPGGVTVPGGVNLPDDDWRSSIAYMAIVVKWIPPMKFTKFLDRVGQIDGLMQGLLPAWSTFDWVSYNSTATLGFILDDEHNLDFECFDS
jgi:hypothetical protein